MANVWVFHSEWRLPAPPHRVHAVLSDDEAMMRAGEKGLRAHLTRTGA